MRLIDKPFPGELPLSIAKRLPSQAPRSSGGCRQRRLGGCTIVQVENELKSKIIPGSSRKAGERTNKSKRFRAETTKNEKNDSRQTVSSPAGPKGLKGLGMENRKIPLKFAKLWYNIHRKEIVGKFLWYRTGFPFT
jgi:hypothetical protein